jgi:MFS family permease
MLDGMIGTVALPAIERDLGTAHADLQWVVTSYTLSRGAGAVTESALTEGFAAAFLIAAGVLLLGAFCAVRTLPPHRAATHRRVIPSL